MASFDPRADLTQLDALYAEIRAWLALPRERVLRFDPAISGWNAEQHVVHCSLANELVGRNLKNLLKKKKNSISIQTMPSSLIYFLSLMKWMVLQNVSKLKISITRIALTKTVCTISQKMLNSVLNAVLLKYQNIALNVDTVFLEWKSFVQIAEIKDRKSSCISSNS